ncbi:hypothetical protein IGI04_028767 [Brassica rapa subsp. trilocularis]|uniref:Uncharacterized protein n=1 Tax=Brassica rapa subsp. trilocularis TaxID=1813537 RepID=A0ABQ7L2V9_BRACM|nr:hypothetical protein IGI04_028767 [Brassica rapa subsp. trilocularis]
MFNHIIAAKRNMELRKQEYSLTKKCSSHQMMDHKALRSSSCTDEAIMISDDEVKETLELNKNKKQRLGSWWDEPGAFNGLNSVVNGLPKSKDAASLVGSSSLPKSKAKKYERALALVQRGKLFDFSDDESHNGGNNKTNQDPLLGSYQTKHNMSHVDDDCFTFCSINDLIIKDTKKGNERSLSSSHHDNNFIDSCEDEILYESSGCSNKGNQHVSLDEFIALSEDKILGESSGSNNNVYRYVTLEELGVSVEDLKSTPWEAFDPTWETRSETMDPWLGGYVKDMLSSTD